MTTKVQHKSAPSKHGSVKTAPDDTEDDTPPPLPKPTPKPKAAKVDDEDDTPPPLPKTTPKASEAEADDEESGPSSIAMRLNNVWETVEVADLIRMVSSAHHPTSMFSRCLQSVGRVAFDFTGILKPDAVELEDVSRFVARVASLQPVEAVIDGKPYENVVEAILALAPANPQEWQVKAVKEAALRYAGIADADNLEVPVSCVIKWLRGLHITGVTTHDLKRRAKELAGVSQRKTRPLASCDAGHVYPETVRAAFPEAPVSDEHQIPLGWLVHRTGILRSNGVEADDIKGPVVVAGRAVNLTTGEQMLRLACCTGGHWVERLVPRADAFDARKVVSLAAYDFPFTSTNARDAVRYISDYERHNRKHLTVERVARQLGWQGGEKATGFLLGDTFVTAAGDAEAGATKAEEKVTFQGADDGDAQIVRGFRTRGTLEGWLAAIAPLDAFPRMRLALYAPCAAPILGIVGARNFVFSTAGESSTGKTTGLQVGASVFGNPDYLAPDTIVHSWDSTSVFRERAPAVQTDLPFFIDESQKAHRWEDVQQTVYDIAQGQGRGRGSQKGLAGRDSFHTVALSTGEKPLVSFSEAGGTRARGFDMWGSPFGETQNLGAFVWQLVNAVGENYGHAGLAYVRHLVANRDKWPAWKAEFKDLVLHFKGKANGNAVVGRVAESLAVIVLAARLLHQAVPIPWAYSDPVEPLFDELVRESKENKAAAALRHVVAWADARPKHFLALDGRDWGRQPPDRDGWVGARPVVEAKSKAAKTTKKFALAFYWQRLAKILEEGKFDAEAVKRSWKQKEWLVCDGDKTADRFEYSIRLGGKKTRMVAITAAAIEAAQGG